MLCGLLLIHGQGNREHPEHRTKRIAARTPGHRRPPRGILIIFVVIVINDFNFDHLTGRKVLEIAQLAGPRPTCLDECIGSAVSFSVFKLETSTAQVRDSTCQVNCLSTTCELVGWNQDTARHEPEM